MNPNELTAFRANHDQFPSSTNKVCKTDSENRGPVVGQTPVQSSQPVSNVWGHE